MTALSALAGRRGRPRGPTVLSLPNDYEYVATRVFPASRERVYRLLTDPSTAAYVFAADPSLVTIEEMDVRPGGRFSIVVRDGEGPPTRFSGEYCELVPPARVVNTFEVTTMPGVVALETDVLEEVSDGTRLTVRWRYATKEDRDKMAGPGSDKTWTETLDRFADLSEAS